MIHYHLLLLLIISYYHNEDSKRDWTWFENTWYSAPSPQPGLQAVEGIDKGLQNWISNYIMDMAALQDNFIIIYQPYEWLRNHKSSWEHYSFLMVLLGKQCTKTQDKGLRSFLEPPRQPMEMHSLYPGAVKTGCGLPSAGPRARWYNLERVSKLRAPHWISHSMFCLFWKTKNTDKMVLHDNWWSWKAAAHFRRAASSPSILHLYPPHDVIDTCPGTLLYITPLCSFRHLGLWLPNRTENSRMTKIISVSAWGLADSGT